MQKILGRLKLLIQVQKGGEVVDGFLVNNVNVLCPGITDFELRDVELCLSGFAV